MNAPLLNLTFHGIGDPGRELEPGEARYWVTTPSYAAIVAAVAGLPRVAISFDDGNASDVRLGLPVLLDHGLTATFFVLAGRLDTDGSLSSADVRHLVSEGMQIGTHGMDHVSWRGMDDQTVVRELVDARAAIAGVAGCDVVAAACPLGRYDRTSLGHLRRLGYERVYTSDRRPARADAWLQSRYSVTREDTPESILELATQHPSIGVRVRRAAVGVWKQLR